MDKEKFLEKVIKAGFKAELNEGIVKIYVENASQIKETTNEILKLVKENKYDKSFGITTFKVA